MSSSPTRLFDPCPSAIIESSVELQHLIDYTTAVLSKPSMAHNNKLASAWRLSSTLPPPSTAILSRCKRSPRRFGERFHRLSMELPRHWVHKILSSLLSPYLQCLTKALLKPEQRLFALKTTVPPKLDSHGYWAEGDQRADKSRLRDEGHHQTVAQLTLPCDTSTEYFHAPVKEIGMGTQTLSKGEP